MRRLHPQGLSHTSSSSSVPSPPAPFQMRDLVIHKQIQVVGRVVFMDRKNGYCRVQVDEAMPLENWEISGVELYQKAL